MLNPLMSFNRGVIRYFKPINKSIKCCRQGCERLMFSNKSHTEVFSGQKDIYKGLTIDSTKLNCNKITFLSGLEASLNHWKQEGNRCIWFKVSLKDAAYVPILADNGFNFHHARDDFVMMYKWLPVDESPALPPASYTNLGVGALVFNDKQQMLAISERNYDYPHWKLPGGYVEKGEDIVDAAVREVKEETGVNCAFQSLITLRHTHKMMFGNSDIYVLLMMKSLSDKINICNREVRDCKWMDIEEYTNHPHVHAFNKYVINTALNYRKKGVKLDIQKKTVKWSKYTRDMNFLILEDCKYE